MKLNQLLSFSSAVKRAFRGIAANTTVGPTVGRVPRLALYRPLAIALAIVLALPPVSWFSSPGSGRFAQAHAQVVGGGCFSPVAPITISPLSATLTPGAQQQFTVTDANGCPVSVTWQNQNGSAFSGPGTMVGNLYTAPSSISQVTLVPLYAQVAGIGIISPGPGAASVSITLQPCNGANILKAACGSGVSAPPFQADLLQLESDAINAYLGLHNLPATDAGVVYAYGRTDLRNAIRATMFSTLLGIINKPASARTAYEQDLYTWLQGLVQKNEIAEYQAAVDQFNFWKADPCNFRLDPQIALQYGLSYNGAPFCYKTDFSAFSLGPTVPAGSYFLAYGLKNSYGQPALTYANFGSLVAGVGLSMGEQIGIAAGAGAVLVGSVGAAVYASTTAALAALESLAFSNVGASSANAAGIATFVVGGETVESLGAGFLSSGPAVIVAIAIAIAVTAAMQVFSNQQAINDLNNLNNKLNQARSTPPDLNAFAKDSSGLGMLKLTETFTAQTLPETPATAALPAPRTADPQFIISGGTPTSTLTYQDWNGNSWSARLYGGWFVQTCSSGSNCPQIDSILGSIRYVDSSGTKWTASRIGQNFVSTKAKPASTDTLCPADTTTGVTPGSDFSKCSSYVSASIPIKDGGGNNIIVRLTPIPAAPVFTSASTFGFTTGQAGTATITTRGYPAAAISLSNGSVLPAGFTFASGNGSATLSYSPGAGAVGQTGTVTFTASNALGSAQQTVTITVATPVTITSSRSLNLTLQVALGCSPFQGMLICSGQPFLVAATGYPAPRLTLNGALPSGLTFTGNGNGTASINGTPSGAPTAFNGNGMPCNPDGTNGEPFTPCTSIIASNGITTATQILAFTASLPPPATLVTRSATFTVGIASQIRVRSTGAVTPVKYISCDGPVIADFGLGSAPSWLTFRDNGDGTGVLSGTPPAGASASYSFCLLPIVFGDLGNRIFPPVAPNFTLNVNGAPLFVSQTISAPLTVGSSGSVSVTLSAGTVSSTSALPQGLTLSTSGSTATITGTPAPGTGGAYYLNFTGSNGAGATSQELQLQIQERPQIISTDSATFLTGPGISSSFAVTTTGYPSVSTQPVSNSSQPPTGPAQGKGMYFTVTGLPPGLQASNLDAAGFATGTLTVQTIPNAVLTPGVYKVTITAENGIGVPATQTLTITIPASTATAPASGTSCNGAYTGPFNGNITVSAGQNCSFIGSASSPAVITGNISQMGGTLNLVNASVSGNVAVQGASAFSISPRTTIGKNLSIDNVASGAATNQVCGTTVSGSMEVNNNAVPVQIGSFYPDACPGNAVKINMNVLNNIGATAVYNNSITKILSCSANVSIAGQGNTAVSKQGQCAGF